MPLFFLLREIKLRMILVLVLFLINSSILFYYHEEIYYYFIESICNFNKTDLNLIYTDVFELLYVSILWSIVIGLILAIPIIYLQIYSFLIPGLTFSERFQYRSIMILSLISILFSIIYSRYVLIPIAWNLFYMGDSSLLNLQPKISSLMSFVGYHLIFVLILFQLPIIYLALRLFIGNINNIDNLGKFYWLKNLSYINGIFLFIFIGLIIWPIDFINLALLIPILILIFEFYSFLLFYIPQIHKSLK